MAKSSPIPGWICKDPCFTVVVRGTPEQLPVDPEELGDDALVVYEPGEPDERPDFHHECPSEGCDTPMTFSADVRQYIGTLKGRQRATGAKTVAGKKRLAKAQKNKTAASFQRSRYNAVKTGQYLRNVTELPATHGQYNFCSGCPFDELCKAKEFSRCAHMIMLTGEAADMLKTPEGHAELTQMLGATNTVILRNMQAQLMRDGVTQEKMVMIPGKGPIPVWERDDKGAIEKDNDDEPIQARDKDGHLIWETETELHPLVRAIPDLNRALNASPGDALATKRTAGDQEAKESLNEALGNLLGESLAEKLNAAVSKEGSGAGSEDLYDEEVDGFADDVSSGSTT